ncbi:PLP-dependent aminotransferase family protein [Collimonas sp. OK412]|uniref:aminotransferase-like domain-containing protein n=1 Tax=Collimonas sp. (strain OK412) TaxID=1801619 RepID=UPI0008EC2E98|nr:DNA-binding transcriptional regulator, MocR family, contains an aminotransferase domain [Collimonas sp. OK412]
MTNTVPPRKLSNSQPPPAPQPLSRDSDTSLVEQIVRSIETRISDRLLRTGARMPSIRQFADSHSVSRFTVVEAYDRLVAKGCLESRRGSGFYVRERSPLLVERGSNSATSLGNHQQPQLIDVVWLVRNMHQQAPHKKMPGSGMFPSEWLDADLIANALRSISRQNPAQLLSYGIPQGFLPLRQQLQLKMAELEIAATPEQFVTTTGVTQALDLVARHFTQPGDVILVDDPSWFLMFASFAALGAKVVGVPRLADGPDMAKLAELVALHKPKLYVLVSVLHNPTSTSLSAAKAFQILKLAEEHDFMIVEDDIYCDMHPGSAIQPATRIAALDQLNRVIYMGGFSKTLSPNLRSGFIATSLELAQHFADRKMLTNLTSAEVGERVVYKILSEGHYRKHLDRLRSKLDSVRDRTIRQMERIGMTVDISTPAGIFVWADTGHDTNVMAEKALAEGFLLAPGALFSPSQLPSSRMRINVAAMSDPAIWRFLEQECGK